MTTVRARELRRTPTTAERRLWAILYAFRQQGYHFRRQHPIGPYYADFACVKAGLVIEADGITHTAINDLAYDQERSAVLQRHGFRVLRFWNNEIIENPDGVFDVIGRALHDVAGLTPTPVPSPSSGGGRPRLRKLRTGLKYLAARTGGADAPLPPPVQGEGLGVGVPTHRPRGAC